MKDNLLYKLSLTLKKADIRQLLKFIFFSCTIAIILLASVTILIEKYTYDAKNELVQNVVSIKSLTEELNNSITLLIRRNIAISSAENITELDNIQHREIIAHKFNNDLNQLKELLPSNSSINLTDKLEYLFHNFLLINDELLKKQTESINLNIQLNENSLKLKNLANKIIDAVDSVSGKIKLKATRSRIKLANDINMAYQPNFDNTPLFYENLLGQQQKVETASHQVQLSAIQIIQLSRKLIQTYNKDALISVRDNEIAQEIRQIHIALNILSGNLKDFPELMSELSRVSVALEQLINILIRHSNSIYNLWKKHLDLNLLIKIHLKNEVDNNTNSMLKTIDDLEENLKSIIQKNSIKAEKTTRLSYFLIILISVSVVGFITTILRSLRYRINHPLDRIKNVINELTIGILGSRLNEKDFAKDEFLLVAKTFNQFAERNEKLINELSTTHDALIENEHRLQAVLENALVGIAHLKDRRFVSVNNRFEEMFGYDRNAIRGMRTDILFSSEKDFTEVGKLAYQGFHEGTNFRSEHLLKHKDGNEFWCAISSKPIDDNDPDAGSIWLYEDISERKHNEEQLKILANYDILTGLPNRSLFMDRLENYIELAKRSDQILSVMFIDLDRFKQVNDSLGHEAGDTLLKSVAHKLSDCLRSSDTVARLGGDEFTVIMVDIKNNTIPERTANKIIKTLKNPTIINGQEIIISPSIGISMFPLDGDNVFELIRNADAAMYHAKELGRNNFQFYSDDMNSESLKKLTLQTRLRRAIENSDFELYFQQQIDIIKNKVVGHEALLRWRDESDNIIPPDLFMPILEDSGMISTLGEWIISESCHAANILLKDSPDPITMAINLSARQFQDKNLLKHLEYTLDQYNIAPNDIELEITETVIMLGTTFTLNTLNNLHDMGCKIVLDDFGTGYSSLAYLKQFPIDKIKIDRSFVRDILTDPSDAAICNAIRAMAESLRVDVIAEGVETREQLDYLIGHGFTTVQGYYYSKPKPISELLKANKDNKTKLKLVR
jgi:diguanylate cyclase (GGDEF)-like protein/PAS domain S-box-containing protein